MPKDLETETAYFYQRELPYLVLKCVFSHLNSTELKWCRLVSRYWNSTIIFDRLVPNISDFYFDFSSTSNSKKSERNIQYENLKQVQELQDIYSRRDAHFGITKLDPKLTLVGVELCPQFASQLYPEFLKVLQKVTKLELKVTNGGRSLLILADLAVLLKCLPQIKTLVLPVEYLIHIQQTGDLFYNEKLDLGLDKVAVENLNLSSVVVTLTPALEKIRDLTLTLQEGTIPDEKTLHEVGLIFSVMRDNLRNLRVRWPTGPAFDGNNILKSQRDSCINSITQTSLNTKVVSFILYPGIQIRRLDLSGCQLPLSIFEEFDFRIVMIYLGAHGLDHVGLNLRGNLIGTSLGATISFLLKESEPDSVPVSDGQKYKTPKQDKLLLSLSLTLEYDNLEHQIENNYMLSLPCISEHLSSLSFVVGTARILSLRQLLPLRESCALDRDFVRYQNLAFLKIEMEKVGHSLFLDFPSISKACVNLKELVFIEGNPELYISKKSFHGKVTALMQKVCSWGFPFAQPKSPVINTIVLRWILESFPKLERLKLWAGMDRVDDSCFISKWNFSSPEEPQPVRRLRNYVPRLEQISLRGVGKHITDETLEGFYGLQNLHAMEILGGHKLTSKGREGLMRTVKTLRKCIIK